ncbi:MAG TPA: DegT/DnrJ/EryC1/StrS family aminotransferase [Terriglobia bacterium]|jgi:dTDP-4-amino-4,6-dideoxygalactose transaminase
MKVSFMDLKKEHDAIRGALLDRWATILDSSAFIGGAPVERFEQAFADFCGVRHGAAVGNGTDALTLALTASGIGSGDEVILPANSFVATAEAVVHAGAIPVFADINRLTYTIDVDRIENLITSRTRALIPVHLYGQPADMDPIVEIARRRGLRIIEDCAQAHGARYHGHRVGSFGDAACFSFYPAKNLGACGDGGAVVTNDPEIAESLRKLRDHGGLRKYEHDVIGYNSRLDAMQAAALELKLKGLDARNALRRKHAAAYRELLSGIDGVVTPFEPEGFEGVYHLYVMRIERGSRDMLQKFLTKSDVQTGIHYPQPIHRTPAFASFSGATCPVAEKYSTEILSLPMYPGLERQQLEHVASLVGKYVESETREVAGRSQR